MILSNSCKSFLICFRLFSITLQEYPMLCVINVDHMKCSSHKLECYFAHTGVHIFWLDGGSNKDIERLINIPEMVRHYESWFCRRGVFQYSLHRGAYDIQHSALRSTTLYTGHIVKHPGHCVADPY